MLTTTFLTQVQHIGVIFVLWFLRLFRLLLLCDNLKKIVTRLLLLLIIFVAFVFYWNRCINTLFTFLFSHGMDDGFLFPVSYFCLPRTQQQQQKRTAQFILFMQEGRRCWRWSLEHETYSHNNIWTFIISYNTLALSHSISFTDTLLALLKDACTYVCTKRKHMMLMYNNFRRGAFVDDVVYFVLLLLLLLLFFSWLLNLRHDNYTETIRNKTKAN